MTKPTPGAVEMEILETLRKTGPATVAQVRKALPEGRTLAHTTVITILRRLEAKGFVQHKKAGRGKALTFFLADSIQSVRQELANKLVQDYFANDRFRLVSSLVGGQRMSTKELEKLRELLNSVETEERDQGA